MIIVPEIETVVILVPRTGSGSLRRVLAEKYARSILLYRHMEADGVPAGYDRWTRIGMVRDPIDRMWSLYKFLRDFGKRSDHDRAYIESMRRSVERPFEDWLLHNDVPFTTPYDSSGRGRYWAQYTTRHPIAENRKSQFIYLRPDLGTKIWRFEQRDLLARSFGIAFDRRDNSTEPEPPPPLSAAAHEYVQRVFAWDIAATSQFNKLEAAE